MFPEAEIIKGCLKKDRNSQRRLFEHYYPKMMGICMRYSKNKEEAKDVLQEGFIKVFDSLKKFKSQSTLETWMSKIIIFTAIDTFRKEIKKQKVFTNYSDLESTISEDANQDILFEVDKKQEISIYDNIQKLPVGYRTVVNMYTVEKYSHSKIAKILGISESTSRSQYSRAKKLLSKYIQVDKYNSIIE